MRIIRLSNSDKLVAIDDQDHAEFSKYTWHLDEGYVKRNCFIDGKHKIIRMHREILGITDPSIKVDHIDHNPLNNQRNNLRIATESQNQANRRVTARKTNKSTSQYKGVRRQTLGKKWEASIRYMGKDYYIGCFATEKQAARAYDKKALEFFGDFAQLNNV